MSERKQCPSCGRRLLLRKDGCWPRHTRKGGGACPSAGVPFAQTSASAPIAKGVRRYHDLVAENQRALGCALTRMDPNCYRSQQEFEEAATLLIGLRQQGFNVSMVQSHFPGLADPDTWGVLVNGQTYFVHGADLVSLDVLNARVGAGASSAQDALAKAIVAGNVPTFLTNPPPVLAV